MNIFVVIPAYNEHRTIDHIVQGLASKGFRVVVIDDGSKDHTIIEANKYGAELIVHNKNGGKGRCLREGLEYALKEGCDAVITMDGDGQHNLDDVDKFINKFKEAGSDVILGNRLHNPKRMPFIRWCTNIFMSFMISMALKRKIHDSQCGYRLLSRNAIEKMALSTTNYEIESEILFEAAGKSLAISTVDIDSIYQGEASQINPFLDTVRFIKFLIKRSV